MSKEGDGKGCFLHKEAVGFEQSQVRGPPILSQVQEQLGCLPQPFLYIFLKCTPTTERIP